MNWEFREACRAASGFSGGSLWMTGVQHGEGSQRAGGMPRAASLVGCRDPPLSAAEPWRGPADSVTKANLVSG